MFLSKVDKKIIKKSANKFLNRFGNQLMYVDEESHSDLISEITKNLFYTEMPNKIEGSVLSKMCNFAYKSGYKVLLTGDLPMKFLVVTIFINNFIIGQFLQNLNLIFY